MAATDGIRNTLDGRQAELFLVLDLLDRHFSPATIATLRQWAVDAQDAFTTWPNKTALQKDATTREVIRRLGLLMTGVADILEGP